MTNRSDQMTAPHSVELKGICGARDRYELNVVTIGPIKAKHFRNIIKHLDLQAQWLETDEACEIIDESKAENTPPTKDNPNA